MRSMTFKKIAIIVLATAVGLTAVYTGFLKINAHLMGLFTKIPDSIEGFDNYEKHLQKAYAKIKTATWEEYRQEELEDLEFRIKQARVMKKVLERLKEMKQLGG